MSRRILVAALALALAACGSRATGEAPGTAPPAPPTPATASAAVVAPRPFVPAAFAGEPCDDLAVGDGFVAWTHAEPCYPTLPPQVRLHTAPTSGGPPLELLGSTSTIGGLAIDAGHLYWTAERLGRVRVARLADGRWGGVVAERAGTSSIAVDATHVYWIDRGPWAPDARSWGRGTFVLRAPRRGGEPTVIAGSLHEADHLAIDDEAVYWTDAAPKPAPEGERRIRRAPKGGGEAEVIAVADRETVLAVDEGFVYWSAGGEWGRRAAIRRAPKRGGSATTLADVPEHPVESLVLDRGFVYVAGRTGAVHRLPKAGGAPVLVAGFELTAAPMLRTAAPALAADASSLWVCVPRGIFRLPLGDTPARPRLLAPQPGGAAAAVAFHPDGRRLLGVDRAEGHVVPGARLYDLASGRVERELPRGVHEPRFGTPFAIDPERRRAFVKRSDHSVERWNLDTGGAVWAADLGEEHGSISAWSLASPAERMLLAHGWSGRRRVSLVDTTSGKHLADWMVGGDGPIALLPDGHVALAAVGKTEPSDGGALVEAWDFQLGKALPAFLGPPQRVTALAISRDGRRLVTGSEEGRITSWDIERRSAIASVETGERALAIAALGAGERAVVGTRTQACVWDLEARALVACSGDDGLGAGSPIAVSPDERTFAWTAGTFFRVWSLDAP